MFNHQFQIHMRMIITTICVLCASYLSAQYVSGFQQEFFYGNLPSAKIEAMGMADAAIGGTVASSFFNSAGLGGIENQEVFLSMSAPFYVLKNSKYLYAGYAARVIPKLVVGLSVNNFKTGETTFDVNIGDKKYPVTKGNTSNYALSAAYSPLKGFYIGLNFNLFRWRLFEDVNAALNFNIDGGLHYKLELPKLEKIRHHMQFGVSVNNVTAGKIKWKAPDGTQAKNALPIIGRFATAYFIGLDINLPVAGKGTLDFTFTLEYQNTFNSSYFSTFSVGFESVLWEVLALRLGYFTQTIDDLGQEVNYKRLSDFTYGFGVVIPLNKLINEKVPLSLHFDYVSLRQPRTSDLGNLKAGLGRIPNMRTFTFRVVWTIPAYSAIKSH